MEKDLHLNAEDYDILRNITSEFRLDIIDMLNLLPEEIKINESVYKLHFSKYESLFYEISYRSEYPYIKFTNSKLIDAIRDMIIWYYKKYKI